MKTWTCAIPGEPIGKGRPRAATIGGRARMYTPGKTQRWEAYAAATLALGWGHDPLRCPVRVTVEAVFSRPQGKVWKTKPMPRYPHVARPDADNVGKAVCDSLEKAGVLHNDSTAWALTVHKWVAAGHEQPHVRVTVMWGDE